MTRYTILVRGINVGGKNKVRMATLKEVLQSLGYTKVSTYIASGNVILESAEPAGQIKAQIEAALLENFEFGGEVIKVLVLNRGQFQSVIVNRPEHFGDRPNEYHSDVIFLIGVDVADALSVFSPREGVDEVWPGEGVIYSQRLSAERTKSRLSKVMTSPVYKSMTIRSWSTTIKLWQLMNKPSGQ